MFDRHKMSQPRIFRRGIFIALILTALIIGPALAYTNFINWLHRLPTTSAAAKTIATNGADQWDDDEQVTTPLSAFSLPDSKDIRVSALFQRYFQKPGMPESLGKPITIAFPTNQGWLQFFVSGALLLPTTQQAHVQNTAGELANLVTKGTEDAETGIVRLPLLQPLLTLGSQVPVGNEDSHLTYLDLRKAATPQLMQLEPVHSSNATHGIFVKGGTRAKKNVGHIIPLAFWNYIQRPDVSPHGWEKDFGTPLTEALPFTISKDGSTHHMLVQAFSRDGLILDQDTLDASHQPTIQRLETGLAYLHTVGLPEATAPKGQMAWSSGDTPILDAPNTGHPLAHIGQNFPLTLRGDTSWANGVLWYHVQWSTPKSISHGWVQSTAITYTSPGKGPVWAAFDALSPNLAAYLASNGSNTGAVVYDVTNQRYYTYNANNQFIVASSMKVPIMLAFLDMLELQGREPDNHEMDLLTTMIENSNNDSASELYYNDIGGADGITNYMQKIGVSGLQADNDAWGYSLITPQAMVDLLTRLQAGTILTDHDRSIALTLMANIEPDQQVGVGDTAPNQASIAMKDGWVTGPDDQWAMNSSGIVTIDKETYIIAVYTQEQQSLDNGQAIARKVCSSVASAFTK